MVGSAKLHRVPVPLRILLVLVLLAGIVVLVLWAAGVWRPTPSNIIAASGIIEARVIEVGTDVQGVVVSRPVEKGQTVQKGQLIAEVADQVAAAQFLQAQAAAEAASKRVQQTDEALRLQQGVSSADVQRAQAATGTARARYRDVETGSRPEEIAAAQAAFRQAQAAVSGARENLRQLQAGLRPEEIRGAEESYRAAEARVASAQAQLADLQAGARPQEIQQAQAAVDKARTALVKASRDYERAEKLIADGAISPQTRDAAAAARDAAQADLDATQERLKLLQAGSRPEQIAAADAALQATVADQRRAQEALTLARKGPREEEIARAAAAVKQTEAAAEAASAQAALVRAGARSGQVQVAAKQVGEAEAVLQQAQAGTGQVAVRQAEVAAARASLAQAQATVEAAKAALDKYRVEAPVDGLVDDTHVRVGEVVRPGSSVVTMVDFTDTYVTVYVPEPELPRVKLGQTAQVFIDGRPGQPFVGRVRRIASQAEFTPKYVQTVEERTRTVFAVEIALENREGILKPGMPVDAKIEVGEAPPPKALPVQGRGSPKGATGGEW